MKQLEKEENKHYVKMVLDQDEADNKMERDKVNNRLKKMKDVQNFQKLQMGDLPE